MEERTNGRMNSFDQSDSEELEIPNKDAEKNSEKESISEQTFTVLDKTETVLDRTETVLDQNNTVLDQTDTALETEEHDTVLEQPETGSERPHTVLEEPATVLKEHETVVEEPKTVLDEPHTVSEQPHTMSQVLKSDNDEPSFKIRTSHEGDVSESLEEKYRPSFEKKIIQNRKEELCFDGRKIENGSEQACTGILESSSDKDSEKAEVESFGDSLLDNNMESTLKNLESKISQLEAQTKINEENINNTKNKISSIEDNLKKDSFNSNYWMEGHKLKKTPLVKENPSHSCQMLPWFVKLSLMFTCITNYADTVTDVVTTVDMFRNHKYVLGGLSFSVIVLVGIWIPFHTRSLKSSEGSESQRTKWKFSWRNLLAALTFSSTQYFILKKFLLNHPSGKYDRRACLGYNNERCRTDKCNNLRHKVRQLHEAVILEKMVENLPQFIIQIINIAPEYLAKNSDIAGFWGYWKLVSLLLTAFSLTRACVKFDFIRLDLNPRLFSFYSVGKGWKALYPQKYLLGVIHSSIIINKSLSVIYLAILVNHDFLTKAKCSLSRALEAVNSEDENNCYFESKVAWLLFLYILAYYSAVALITLHVIPCYVYKHSLKNILEGISSLGARICYILKFVGGLWCIYIINSVLQQRHYMFDATNHLKNVGWAKFVVRTYPSLLHAAGTITFSILFYKKGNESFSNVDIGITPFHLTLIGVTIEAIHLISLLILIYKADPSQVQSLSDEKIVEYLIRKNKVGKDVDVSCSKKAKDIIKEVVKSNDGTCEVYKEDIRDDIIKFSRMLPPNKQFRGIAEFNRIYAEAIRKYSGIQENETFGYSLIQQEEKEKVANKNDSGTSNV